MGKRGPKNKYPWPEWFSRIVPFVLRRGTDYHCATTTFMQMVRSRATKVGARVSIRVLDDNSFTVRIYKEQ